MLGYYDLFPEKFETELRSAHFPDMGDDDPFPAGTYAFTEYYCPDLSCDCQRVIVKALYYRDRQSMPKEVATISYTWNDTPDAALNFFLGDITNPFLDPLHPQADYADSLMEFWHDMLCHDRRYAERLQKHYAEVRQVHGHSGMSRTHNKTPATTVSIDPAEKKRRFRSLRQTQKRKRKHRARK